MTWPGTPPTYDAPRRHEGAAPLLHRESLSSSAARTPAERLDALLREWRLNRRQSGDLWRRRCEILDQIHRDELWRGAGDRDFDAWAWRVLHLRSVHVARMLAIARGPIGGERRGGPGRQPAHASDAAAFRHSLRLDAEGAAAPAEVETVRNDLNLSAPDRGFLPWAARTLDRLEAAGVAELLAGIPEAERAGAVGVFAGLRDFFRRCEEETR